MGRPTRRRAIAVAALGLLGAGAHADRQEASPVRMLEAIVTSEAGERLAPAETAAFRAGQPAGVAVVIDPTDVRQTIEGIGSSFTESSAFVLAHLPVDERRALMRRIFGAEGANLTLTRTHIGSCDFSVEGRYSYLESPDAAFTIAPDIAGFDPARYPGVRDASYDLLPMILEAQAIKAEQGDAPPKIIASAWTAPPWMKDIGEWFIPGSEENDWQGTGGWLLPEHEATYARYLVDYLDAYAEAGVDIWGLTPVNEPQGNGGGWESLHFTAESQAAFIREHLGPRLRASAHRDVRLLAYDQNRDHLEEWADAILGDPATAAFVHGMAIHWYSHTERVYEDLFERLHARYPEAALIQTEGCIDNLGNPAPEGGVLDPAGYEESGWFANDAFWWNRTATDWAYSVTWEGVDASEHPMYVPVHRYARDMIVGINHRLNGWLDWNIILDARGGPNHVGNFCGAPIMIDTATGEVYETPLFPVLAQLSRTVRPGDRAVGTSIDRGALGPDDLHACATINGEGVVSVQVLNTTKRAIPFTLAFGDRVAEVRIPANAVKTLRIATR